MDYFILNGTQTEGPFSEEDLRNGLASGQLTENELVRSDEGRLWTRLGKVLQELDAPLQTARPPVAAPVAGESRGSFAERWMGSRAHLVQRVEEEPLPIGLAAIVITCMLALLVRWPVLLLLPGIALGVCCGLALIVRNRPIVGGLLSLAALLLPLTFLPSRPAAPLLPAESVAPLETVRTTQPLTPPARSAKPLDPLAPAAPALADTPPPPPVAPLPSTLEPAPPGPETRSALAPAPPLPSASTAPLPAQPEDVVFSIETNRGRGSGFIAAAGEKVYFFTNHHVLEGAEKVTIRGGLQAPQNLGAIIEIAADRDLVRVPVADRPALRFAGETHPGETVVAFGENGTRLVGTVARVGPRELDVSAAFLAGNSGSPIINDTAEVLGVATFASRTESLPARVKPAPSPPERRRFALRVTDEIRWERMLMTSYQANSARVADMEAILTEIVGFANQLAQKPFRSEINTRFPQSTDLRAWVEAYNQSTRTRMMPNQSKMRDYARRLMGTVAATQTALQADVRSPRLAPSKGYLKQREDELLKSFGAVNDEIAKVFEVRS